MMLGRILSSAGTMKILQRLDTKSEGSTLGMSQEDPSDPRSEGSNLGVSQEDPGLLGSSGH